MNEVLNFGMVGGGSGSLIGEVHRKAASFDRKAKLVAGCFSRSYDNTLSTGKSWIWIPDDFIKILGKWPRKRE